MEKKPLKEADMGFASLNEDILDKVLRRLPAASFASSACVSKSWCQICNRILSRPKLASALSINPSIDIALQEILDKVLSEPIRPHFVIANGFGYDSGPQKAFDFLAGKLGSRTPLIVTWPSGLMGRDARTNEFKEVMGIDDDDDGVEIEDLVTSSGILLTVGFVPGLKVEAIPLLKPFQRARHSSTGEDLVLDIKNFTLSASGCTSPVAVIMFGDEGVDLKPIIEKLDYAMSKETIIAGDASTKFLYRSGIESKNVCGSRRYFKEVITLVFARDRQKPQGIGEIQFHAALSDGLSKLDPRYRAASVRVSAPSVTWLTARREGEPEILNGSMLEEEINRELQNNEGAGGIDLYIGVTRQRKCSVGTERSRVMSSLAFHGVFGANEDYLLVHDSGIRTADYFQVYQSDPMVALSSSDTVSENLRMLKLDWSCKKECIGGFIFSCCGRGKPFFGCDNVDSSPMLNNFPEVPVAGMFCGGEIGRGISITNAPEEQEQEKEATPSRLLHVFSTVFLLMTYTPPPPQRHLDMA